MRAAAVTNGRQMNLAPHGHQQGAEGVALRGPLPVVGSSLKGAAERVGCPLHAGSEVGEGQGFALGERRSKGLRGLAVRRRPAQVDRTRRPWSNLR